MKRIPDDVIRRLPLYLRKLDSMYEKGHRRVSSGELCRTEQSSTLYCPAPEGRAKILLQAFSHRMIENAYVMSIPLPDDDLRAGNVDMTVNERVGTALCEVTQIGKECHQDCAIRKAAGDCVMPREGIFVKVLEDGRVRPGDGIEVITE